MRECGLKQTAWSFAGMLFTIVATMGRRSGPVDHNEPTTLPTASACPAGPVSFATVGQAEFPIALKQRPLPSTPHRLSRPSPQSAEDAGKTNRLGLHVRLGGKLPLHKALAQ